MKKKGMMSCFLHGRVFSKCLSLALVVACVATMAWLFAVPAPVKAATTPTLTNVGVTPATAWQGSTVTMSYTINNPGSTSLNIGLGATAILQSPYTELNDVVDESVVSVPPGTATYTRAFKLPSNAPPGGYTVYWGIWSGAPGPGATEYDWAYRNNGLTVVVAPTVTLCFDDGYDATYQNGFPAINSFGFQATVFMITGLSSFEGSALMSLSQLTSLHNAGWEIGSHTVDHVSLVGLSQASLQHELADSETWLVNNGFGPVNALAYPFGQADANTYAATLNYYKYGRTIIDGINNYGSPNVALNTALLWGNSGYSSLADAENIVNQAISSNRWAIVTMHGVVADPNDSRVNSTNDWCTTDLLTTFLQFLKGTGVPVKTFAQMEGNSSPVNHAPVANADSYTTNKNTTLSVAAPGVLANDTDADGDTLTAVLGTTTTHGTLTLNANGSFTYVPNTGYYGSDSFTYAASDGKTTSNTATVTITITNINHAPVAVIDSYTVAQGNVLTAPAPGVLGNDTDADGDTLTAVKMTDPAHGTLALNSNGSFTYTPVSTYSGTDSFTYAANDGKVNSNNATVTITVTPPAGSTATFGLNSGSQTFYDGSDQMELQRFQNTAGSGTLTKLELLFNAGGYFGGNIRLAVYADNSGAPGALLLDAGEVAGVNGWVSISGLNLPVTSNTYYWLAFNMSGANIIVCQAGPANSHLWMNQGYGAFPTTFPALNDRIGVGSTQYVMRATVTK